LRITLGKTKVNFNFLFIACMKSVGCQVFRQLPVCDPEKAIAEDSVQVLLVKPGKLVIRVTGISVVNTSGRLHL
jgi:hypothetical protein